MVLEDAKQKYPYLFGKPGARLGSNIPKSNVAEKSSSSNDISKKSDEELLAILDSQL